MKNIEIGVGICDSIFGKEFTSEITEKINKFADNLGNFYKDAFKLAEIAMEQGKHLGGGRVSQYFIDYYMLNDIIIEVQQYSSGDNIGKSMGFVINIENIRDAYLVNESGEYMFLEYVLNKLE